MASLGGTETSASNGTPSVFIEQLHDGLPIEGMTFPDAFEILPGSWEFNAAVAINDTGMPPICSCCCACDTAYCGNNASVLRPRNIHDEQREQLRRRANRCRALQCSAGQATIHDGTLTLAGTAACEMEATPRRLWQEETRDWPHAVWATEHRGAFLWYARERFNGIQTLRERQRERMELEHYAGSTRDKMLLAQKRRLQWTRGFSDTNSFNYNSSRSMTME